MKEEETVSSRPYDCPLRSGRTCSAREVDLVTSQGRPTGEGRIFDVDGWRIQVTEANTEPCRALFVSLDQTRDNLGLIKLESLQSYLGKLPSCVRRGGKALKTVK